MKTVELIQGSDAWHAHRAQHWNASDAPAMLGCSKYKGRNDLIAELATGRTEEVGAALQRVFDDGHRFEALSRPIAAEIIGEKLYPVVGVLGRYSASFDGLTMGEDTGYEHKTLNDDLRAALPHAGRDSHEHNDAAQLPKMFRVQMEQQLMVSEGERILFCATKYDEAGNLLEERHCWYYPDEALRAEIEAGWPLLQQEVDNYTAPEVVQAAVAAPIKELPTLFVQARGEVTDTNMPEFKVLITQFLETVNLKPETDQEFADGKAIAPKLRELAAKIKERKEDMLAQTATIGEVAKEIDYLAALLNEKALELEKAIEREEKARKASITQTGKDALKAHIDQLNAELKIVSLPAITANFDDAIKGKRLIPKMEEAVNTLLAQKKIEANAAFESIKFNLVTYGEFASGFESLFPDLKTLVLKGTDDFTSTVKLRIAEHREAERKRLEREAEEARQAEAQRQAAEDAAKVIEADRKTPPAEDLAAKEVATRTTLVDVIPSNVAPIRPASSGVMSDDELRAEIITRVQTMTRQQLNQTLMFCKEKLAA